MFEETEEMPASIEVFYIGTKTGWAVAKKDEDYNQIGEAEYCFHKKDAIERAREISFGFCHEAPIYVFGKDGKLLYQAETAAKYYHKYPAR